MIFFYLAPQPGFTVNINETGLQGYGGYGWPQPQQPSTIINVTEYLYNLSKESILREEVCLYACVMDFFFKESCSSDCNRYWQRWMSFMPS